MTDEQLIQIALDCGATRAEIIGQESIVLNPEFRTLCEANRCGAYGKCYMCPPDVGPVDELIQTALDCGATHAEIIGQESIVLNAEFRTMCEANRCGAYGKCYMCPPDVGPVDELMRKIRGYEKGLFYQVIAPLEDSFDIEGMAEAKKLLVQLSQRLLDALRPVFGDGALHLSGGGCGLCPTCAKATEEPCRHPDRAMASLESCGMDVYNTTKHTSMKYVNGANTVTYFGMVLYTEREHG